jgi:LPS sulfotransferase NodH
MQERGDAMSWCYREPTLAEMLSDTIVKSVMEADGVDPSELEAMMSQMAAARTGDWWKRFGTERKSPGKIGQECL